MEEAESKSTGGRAVEIVSFDVKNSRATLYDEKLSHIIRSRPKIRDMPTRIISIGCVARLGKSFLLNLLAGEANYSDGANSFIITEIEHLQQAVEEEQNAEEERLREQLNYLKTEIEHLQQAMEEALNAEKERLRERFNYHMQRRTRYTVPTIMSFAPTLVLKRGNSGSPDYVYEEKISKGLRPIESYPNTSGIQKRKDVSPGIRSEDTQTCGTSYRSEDRVDLMTSAKFKFLYSTLVQALNLEGSAGTDSNTEKKNDLMSTALPEPSTLTDALLENVLLIGYRKAVMHLYDSTDKLIDQMKIFSSEEEMMRTLTYEFESAYALFKTAGQSEYHSHLPMWRKFSKKLNTMFESRKKSLITSFRRKNIIYEETQRQDVLLCQLQKLVIAAQ